MSMWNRQHGQCNFLLKWFVRMSLCTNGSQSLACHRHIDCDSALRHCMLISHTKEICRACDVHHHLPVVLRDWPLCLWCVWGLTAVTTHRITGCAVCHDPAKAVYTDGTPAC